MSQIPTRILFIHSGMRSFIRRDFEALQRAYPVTEINTYPLGFFRFPALVHEIQKAQLMFVWFAGRHAVLPMALAKIFRKKVVIVAGGWDLCAEVGRDMWHNGYSGRPIV